MEGRGIRLKRVRTESLVEVDPCKCIICQEKTSDATSSSEVGRNRIIEAASIRNDDVSRRVNSVDPTKIQYHVTNKCYKSYTLKTNLERIQKQNSSRYIESNTAKENVEGRPKPGHTRRSSSTSRTPPNNNMDIYRTTCVICGNMKHRNVYDKYRISECGRADKLLQATVYLQDDVYVRICDLETVESVFGADIYYHSACMLSYLRKYERLLADEGSKHSPINEKIEVFNKLIAEMKPGLNTGEGFALSDIRDQANTKLEGEIPFSNREVKILLLNHFGDNINITISQNVRKSAMAFLKTCNIDDMADKIRLTDPINECATILRNSLMDVNFGLQDKFCDASDLEDSWNNIDIPQPLLKFLSVMYNFNEHEFCTAKPSIIGEEDQDPTKHGISKSKEKQMLAIYQIMYFVLHSGQKRTPLHIMNGQAIHETCKSKTLISSFNHCGLCVSYDEILRYHTNMANFVVEKSDEFTPLPSQFDRKMFTTGALDNFDHEELTLSGIGGSHDTVCVLFQDKPTSTSHKPNMSDTSVIHGSKVFKRELPCQTLKEYFKPSRKSDLPPNYIVEDNLFMMERDKKEEVSKKDLVWSLARLDLSNIDTGIVEAICSSQTMPTWSAFNSLISEDDIPEKIVGFLPVIPHPVTDYKTVYSALKNFQSILSQLEQDHMPVTCDEGVYHIAREIILDHPEEFKNLVLCMGSFHMMKIVLACFGKYLNGSGARQIWTETGIFGVNVFESVIAGTNYVRSLKGMLLLSESMERLRWCEFFKENNVENYKNVLQVVCDIKISTEQKNRERSQGLVNKFCKISDEIQNDFDKFNKDRRDKSETWAYWDTFIQMVALLKDLIRADREGNWPLHLHSVQALLPLFAVFDRINYLRWCSLYLEDMRKLVDTAPDIFESFMAGKFVIKRTQGFFKAVGADMCLEQTINRSQKSSGGIIGSTRKKEFVTEWEIIYHEMLAVSNLYRCITGVKANYSELTVNHEFRQSETDSTEDKLSQMISFIQSCENPFHASDPMEFKLHNILTKEIMSEDIRKDLLNIQETGSGLYKSFRKERFLEKTKHITDTIHRTNLRTFLSIKKEEKRTTMLKKDLQKQYTQVQKILDLAQVRKYDTKELFKYDLIKFSYLFDEEGLLTRPQKSLLTKELEKVLSQDDYGSPLEWDDCHTSYIVDVMAYVRKVKMKPLKTFGEFCDVFLTSILNISKNASRIDMVFDTYIEGSVKDSERLRRSKVSPIEISKVKSDTPLPTDMDRFWSSCANKIKLQLLLIKWISDNVKAKCPNVQLVLSGISGQESSDCICIQQFSVTSLPELDIAIEEADVRIIPHAMHVTTAGTTRLVVLSSDTDVLVLILYYWNLFHNHGLKELWVRAGSMDTIRYIPVHILAEKSTPGLCAVLPALHTLTGCDATSKFGTKPAALRANPIQYLKGFGSSPHGSDIEFVIAKAEEYLVQVVKPGSEWKTMDDLRYWMYHHSKGKTIDQLPPTSYSTRGHILRAFYVTHLQINCLFTPELDPKQFGFEDVDGVLMPVHYRRLLPTNFAAECNCIKCATSRCSCRKNLVSCCRFCKCQSVLSNEIDCNNPFGSS